MNENLKAYLDNALPESERQVIEAELAINPALQAELEELRAIGQYIEASAKSITITGLEGTISALSSKPKRTWFRSPYAVLAACTIVLALGMSVYKPDFSQAEVASDAILAQTVSPASSEATSAESIAPADRERAQSPSEELLKSKGGSQFDSAAGESPGRSQTRSNTDGLYGDTAHESERPNQPNASANPQANIPADNRLIIKSASLSVRVKQLELAAAQTETIAKRYGGFIESSNLSGGTTKYANYTVRVESKYFDRAMADLRKLGDVTSESTDGQDVTAQVADTEARLKQKRLEETQYQEVLKSAKKISDILEVKDYISNIREEIESTEAQLKSLRNLSSLSTINIGLEQREEVKPAPRTDWLSNSWIRAMNRFSGIGRTIVSTLINILVLAPFWLPFAIGIWWWNRKRKGK